MQPDKLEARCCRKRQNAKVKSPKSRCCKVKGLPGGGLFDIGVYIFSDHAWSLFMSRG
jgi:hypothetical protein